jgi:hypothetical protein
VVVEVRWEKMGLNEIPVINITGRNPRLYKKDNDGVWVKVGVFESIDVRAKPVTYSYEGEQRYEIEWILSNGDLFTPRESLPDFTVLDGCFFEIYFACSSIQYGDKIMFFLIKSRSCNIAWTIAQCQETVVIPLATGCLQSCEGLLTVLTGMKWVMWKAMFFHWGIEHGKHPGI